MHVFLSNLLELLINANCLINIVDHWLIQTSTLNSTTNVMITNKISPLQLIPKNLMGTNTLIDDPYILFDKAYENKWLMHLPFDQPYLVIFRNTSWIDLLLTLLRMISISDRHQIGMQLLASQRISL